MSIRSKRKDDHVELALSIANSTNDFSKVKFVHNSLPNLNWDDIHLKANYLNFSFNYPVYINAMTGGSEKTKILNARLAEVAKHFGLAMSVGSQHVALDNPEYASSFSIIRDAYPDGFFIANVSANASVSMAQKAIDMISANALGIHINIAQEITMDEGDRDFKHWLDNIKAIVEGVNVPVIVKEVGFGMSEKTVETLISLGVKHVDVSGNGGTNFIAIENARSKKKRFDYLMDWGHSPVESLLMTRKYHQDVEMLASGGVKNPLDVIKLCRLGAQGVGISKMFLEAVQDETTMIEEVREFLIDLKKVMMLIGVSNLAELKTAPIQLNESLVRYDGTQE